MARPPTAANNDNDDDPTRIMNMTVFEIACMKEDQNLDPEPPEPSPKRYKLMDPANGMHYYTEVADGVAYSVDALDYGPYYDERDRRGPPLGQSAGEYVDHCVKWLADHGGPRGLSFCKCAKDCAKWFVDQRPVVTNREFCDGVVKWFLDADGEQHLVADTGTSDILGGDVSDNNGGDIACAHVGDAADEHGENANPEDDDPVGCRAKATLAQVYLYSLTRLASKGY
jgi:hypothetical protein